VIYWNSPLSLESPPYPHCIIQEGGEDEGESLQDKSTAYFVLAVIDLLGMRAEQHGRRACGADHQIRQPGPESVSSDHLALPR
jgi:hypothetical protein